LIELQSFSIGFSKISPAVSDAVIVYPSFEWTLEALHPSIEDINFIWATQDFINFERLDMTFLDPGVICARFIESTATYNRFISSEEISQVNIITDSTLGVMEKVNIVFECMDDFAESLTIFVDGTNEYTVQTSKTPATHLCQLNLTDGYHVISFSGGMIGNFTIYTK